MRDADESRDPTSKIIRNGRETHPLNNMGPENLPVFWRNLALRPPFAGCLFGIRVNLGSRKPQRGRSANAARHASGTLR